MKLSKENFFVSFVDESMKDYFFEKPIIYNVELLLFCLPEIINGPWIKVVREVKNVFKKYPVQRHIHGPFMDLAYHSRDQEVCDLARRKIELGLAIAGDIGAGHIVFHSTYNPLVADPSYIKVWSQRTAQFWSELIPIAERNKCIIVIENVYDNAPKLLKKLVQQVNSPYFKVCFDVGHAHIFGNVPLEKWITTFKNDLIHIHLHDNSKIYDEHGGLGTGTIDFKKFFASIDKLRLSPAFVLEVKNDKELEKSIQYLKKNRYWKENKL